MDILGSPGEYTQVGSLAWVEDQKERKRVAVLELADSGQIINQKQYIILCGVAGISALKNIKNTTSPHYIPI